MKFFKNPVIDEPLGFSTQSANLSSFTKNALTKKEISSLKGGGGVIDEPF